MEPLFRALSESNVWMLVDPEPSAFRGMSELAFTQEPADRDSSGWFYIPRRYPAPAADVSGKWRKAGPLPVRANNWALFAGGNTVLDFIQDFLLKVLRKDLASDFPRKDVTLSPEISAVLQRYRQSRNRPLRFGLTNSRFASDAD